MKLDYRRIKVEELEEHEKSQLLSECASNTFEPQLHEILEYIENNQMAAYRWSGGFDGLMVIRVYKHLSGSELFIWHLSGRGFLENIHEVQRLLKRLGRELDCRWVSCEARNKALMVIYAKLAKLQSCKFVMEIE